MPESTLRIEPTGESRSVASVPPLSIHKVVVGYESDACSHNALVWAETMATAFGAELIVTHSVPPPPGVIDVYYEQLKEEVLEEADTTVTASILRELHYPDRAITKVVSFDRPTKLILRTASDMDADLVVVGSHGRKGIDQFLFGSVSESLAFRCTCPVLVCGPECEAPTAHRKTVLFASTPAETSVRAAEYAEAFAQQAGVKLIALHTLAERPSREAHDRLWKEDYARELMRIALADAPRPDRKIQYDVLYGDPAAEVLALADREDVGLIVLGTGERLAGADHFAWHPAGEILRSAPCPVLIVSDKAK